MNVSARALSDVDAFELPEWDKLLERDPERHIFATPEWNRLWWEEFGLGRRLVTVVLHDGDEAVGVCPLYVAEEGEPEILRFVGGVELTDYCGPVCAPEDRSTVAEGLVGWLCARGGVLDAHNLPVPLGFAEMLAERADAAGLDLELHQEDTSAVLDLPASWDEYLAGLGAKHRHELRRKRRRMGTTHPDARVRRATQETLEDDLKSFVDLHREAAGYKGHFMRPDVATFFARVARGFVLTDWLRLDLLEISGHVAAATFGFVYNGTFYLYNSAYDPALGRVSPGIVLVSELIRLAIDDGLRRFDFLRGAERYKYTLGASAVPLHQVRVSTPA